MLGMSFANSAKKIRLGHADAVDADVAAAAATADAPAVYKRMAKANAQAFRTMLVLECNPIYLKI